MLLVFALALLLLAAVGAFFVKYLPASIQSVVLPLPALGSFVCFLLAGINWMRDGKEVSVSVPWVELLELDFSLRLHGLGLLMGLLITGIGALIQLYASGYMKGHSQAHRLYAYLYAFMFAMTGVVVANHLLLLFVFWELTSITSYLLIGFNHANAKARANALQALVVTGLGGMALLAGFILLRVVAGTWLLSDLLAQREVILTSGLYGGILTLILLGAFTKSAQFPFHFWLPNAMAAPTPVSAYLHSATMVKAGVFLLAVMLPILGGTAAWSWALCLSGGITLLLGGFFGLRQSDLKTILAATTLAVLGLLTLLLGIGSEKAALAAILFLFGHALYKATLFMSAGSVDHEAGTRDLGLLGGLGKLMPFTAAAAGVAALSKMGFPPLFGFLGKEYTYKASIYEGYESKYAALPLLEGPLVTGILVLGNALIFALAFKAAFLPYWRKEARGELPKKPHEAPWTMLVGPLVLATAGLVLGMMPQFVEPLVSKAKSALVGHEAHAHLKLWHGWNIALLLSGVTLALGALLAWRHEQINKMMQKLVFPGAEFVYEKVFAGVLRFAHWHTRHLQSGILRHYLLIIFLATTLLVTLNLWQFRGLDLPEVDWGIPPSVWAVFVLMIVGVIMAIRSDSRLGALVALGLVGFGVAFLFAFLSAPDLAVTQILVESLSVALFAWAVYKLPLFKKVASSRKRVVDGVVALSIGLLVTVLVLRAQEVNLAPPISETLSEWSLSKAYGANVVNVILVDFRALDTWGEITVLSIAALGVWALLSGVKNGVKKTQAQAVTGEQTQAEEGEFELEAKKEEQA